MPLPQRLAPPGATLRPARVAVVKAPSHARVRSPWRLTLFSLIWLIGALVLGLSAQNDTGAGRTAHLLTLDGAVSPVSADYLIRGIAAAADDGAALVIIKMDTPGGLVTSTRDINRAILGSPVPVAVFVAPSGARAASAGTFIFYAGHVAAMAPGTSIGAATPVAIGGGLPFGDRGEEAPADDDAAPQDAAGADAPGDDDAPRTAPARPPADAGMAKAINDAVAQIRGLAELRGRNADWAERAVREAATLTASAAARANVADFVARDIAELLERADGMVVDLDGQEVTLDTAGLIVVDQGPDWRTQLLSIIADPNIAVLLLVLGFYGILFELLNPGALFPGTIGGISLLLGMFALSILPFNMAGLGLIVLGLLLVIAEAFSPAFGILGIGGTIAIVLGALLLFDSDVPGFEPSYPMLGALAAASLVFSLVVARLAVKVHRRRATTGSEEMIGTRGQVQDWAGTEGHVLVHGERWKARSSAALRAGQAVTVTAIAGLWLTVVPVSDTQEEPAQG